MAEREADRRARRLLLGELESLQQQLGRLGFAEQVLRKAELAQQLGSDSRRGRLGERPAQIPHGTVGGAARLRGAGRRAQHDHGLRVAVRVGCEQVDGGLLGIAGQTALRRAAACPSARWRGCPGRSRCARPGARTAPGGPARARRARSASRRARLSRPARALPARPPATARRPRPAPPARVRARARPAPADRPAAAPPSRSAAVRAGAQPPGRAVSPRRDRGPAPAAAHRARTGSRASSRGRRRRARAARPRRGGRARSRRPRRAIAPPGAAAAPRASNRPAAPAPRSPRLFAGSRRSPPARPPGASPGSAETGATERRPTADRRRRQAAASARPG